MDDDSSSPIIDFLLRCDEADCKGDRKDQTIYSACKYQQNCRISQNKHNCCRDYDKYDDHFIFVLFDLLIEGLEE